MSNDAALPSRRWSPEVIRDLLTTDRLRSYLVSCDQDLDRALRLYEWNLTASAAVMQTTAMGRPHRTIGEPDRPLSHYFLAATDTQHPAEVLQVGRDGRHGRTLVE